MHQALSRAFLLATLMRAGGRTAHPRFWAPFVLWGLPD